MKKTRLTALFFVAALLAALFAGCAAGEPAATTEASTTSTAATTAAVSTAAASTTATSAATAATTATTTTAAPATTVATTAPYRSLQAASMPTDSAYHAEIDWPYGLNTAMSVRNMVSTDIGYYMVLTNFLFYMDADAMEPVPVCAKPNCLHYNEEEIERINACNAFMNVEGMQASLSCYDDKLWFIGQVETINDPEHPFQFAVQSMEPDGSSRKVVYRFDPECGVDYGVLHRGVFYVVLTSFDEEVRSKATLMACSLSDPRQAPECILELECFGGDGGFIGLTAYGDRLYFYRYISDDGDREFCSFDLETGELTAFPIVDELYLPLNVATFIGDKIYLTCRTEVPQGDPKDENSYPERLYRCDLDGSDLELLFDGWGDYVSDQQYLYRVPNYVSIGPDDHTVNIYDADGQEVDSVDLAALANPGDIWEAGVMVPPVDQTILWFESFGENGVRMYLYWFDKAEIGSGEIVVHPICNYSMTANSSTPGSEVFDFDTAGMLEMAAAAVANKAE